MQTYSESNILNIINLDNILIQNREAITKCTNVKCDERYNTFSMQKEMEDYGVTFL